MRIPGLQILPSRVSLRHAQRSLKYPPVAASGHKIMKSPNRMKLLIISCVICGCMMFNSEMASGERITDPSLYGSALRGDSLGNVPLLPNSYGGRTASFRFRAPISGQVTSIIYYNQHQIEREYGKGDGGIILIELRADDGTNNHWPSETILASCTLSSPMTAGYFPLLRFNDQVQIHAGKLYHIVFTNMHSHPTQNYVSINCLHNFREQPNVNLDVGIGDVDLAVLVRNDTAEIWKQRYQSTPIFNLFFSDGRAIGQGYASAISGWDYTVTSMNKVRETFVIDGSTKQVGEVFVRVHRNSGDLNIRLEKQDGTLIEEGVCSGSDWVPDETRLYKMGWCSYRFKTAQALELGKAYNLVLHSKNGSYITFGLLKGGRYGFKSKTYFPDGWAQYSTDGGGYWQDYNYGSPTKDVDLQFYFTPTHGSNPRTAGEKRPVP